MIKKLFLTVFILFLCNTIIAKECEIICPAESTKIIEDETFINKVTGMSFLSKQVAEMIIQKELKDELNSKITAGMEIFNIKRLKKGEFKSLKLTGRQLRYKALSLSNFQAQTICPYNKVYYKKGRIYYLKDLPFKYKAEITNEDIKNVINSSEFKKQLERSSPHYNNIKVFTIETPAVEIKENKLYFKFPVQTLFGKLNIQFSSEIEVKNNKIMLKNITFNKKSNIISYDTLSPVINKINPITYETEAIESKYCKIYITGAKISDNIIKTEGIFVIKKNYGENE